jgi:hypothetical protein
MLLAIADDVVAIWIVAIILCAALIYHFAK